MAKKNLHNLMSGIIGSENNNDSASSRQESSTSRKPSDAGETKSPPAAPGRGRPKKENDDTRTTLIISAELLRKVKYVSLMEDITLKEVVDEALSLYVAKWEQENIPIRLPKK